MVRKTMVRRRKVVNAHDCSKLPFRRGPAATHPSSVRRRM